MTKISLSGCLSSFGQVDQVSPTDWAIKFFLYPLIKAFLMENVVALQLIDFTPLFIL